MNPEPSPASSSAAGSKFSVSLADLLVAGGAAVILLFSWADVVSSPSIDALRSLGISGVDEPDLSLWSWLAPLGIFVILAALCLLISAAIEPWWHREHQQVGVNRHHLQVGLALYALITIFGMAMAGTGFSISWGGVIQLLGALVATGGAVLNHFNLLQNKVALPTGSTPAHRASVAYPPQQGGSVDPTPTSSDQNPPVS